MLFLYVKECIHKSLTMTFFSLKAQCNDAWTRCIIFIGGNDRDNEGSFVWSSDNRTLDFYNWSPVEPNSYTVNDDCIVILYPGGEWADFGCTPTRPFLCKKPLSNL